jgi:hypothetical protein
MVVSKVQDKAFMGKDIIHVDVFRKMTIAEYIISFILDGKPR